MRLGDVVMDFQTPLTSSVLLPHDPAEEMGGEGVTVVVTISLFTVSLDYIK